MICTVVGIYISKVLLDNNYYTDNSDPSEIVIDEFAGFFVTIAFVELNIYSLVLCFILFRIFDILKPYPISKIDSMHGALGIMLDDVLAGVFAGATALLLIASTAMAQTGGLAAEEFKLATSNFNRGKLAFVYEKANSSDIYYINFSEQKIKPLVVNSEKKSCPSWDPSGSKLAYSVSNKKVIVLNTSDSSKTEFKGLSCPNWSNKNNQIVATSKNSLNIIDTEKAKVRNIYTSKKSKKIYNAKWSPRGDEIIFSTDQYWPGRDLELYNIKTNKKTILTSGYQNFFLASWHPSGGSFISSYGLDNVDIWEYSKGMKHPEILFQRQGEDLHGTWTEDGEILFFVGEIKNKTYQLFYWVKSQGKIFQLTNAKGSIKELSWNPLTGKNN